MRYVPDSTDSQTISIEALLRGLVDVPALLARVGALETKCAALEAKLVQATRKRKQWYNLKEAMEALNCKERKVRYYISSGVLSKNLASRTIQIPAKEVENLAGRVTLSRC